MPARTAATTPPEPARPTAAVVLLDGTVDVTVVLVAHNGERWLPEVLTALDAGTVRPRRTIAVDTGSSDGTVGLLAAATGAGIDRVVTVGRAVGYGAAVAQGLAAEPDAAGGASAWVWLLHDDSAPAPDALEQLLAQARDSPSVALLGAKARDWDDPRVLAELGLTTDRAGHRESGLERGEQDQGQHDVVREVLAVGTAGALVRRDVWDALGGLDPALPVFRDDLDLGWRVNAAGHAVVVVPGAVIRHARAATTGRRRLHAAPGRHEGIDRRHALLVLLAHAPGPRLPLLVARLVLATAVRVLGFLLTRQPVQALDELSAAGSVLLRPGRLRAARRLRARTRTLPARALRPLFASRRARARARADALGEWLGGPAGPRASGLLGGTGDGEGAAPPAPRPGRSAPVRLLGRPVVLLTLGLLALALLAERNVLSTGGGVLSGGRLLPAGGGARELWAAYAASWHPVSVGSAQAAPPLLAMVALLATVLLGKAWLAVDVLLLASVPLAGAAAYVAARTVVRHEVLRLWAAATWALLPVASGAIAAGRLDAAAAQVGLPLLLPAGARLLREDPRDVGWRRAWAAGLGLALLTAFSPVLWALLVPALLLALVARSRHTGRAADGRRTGAAGRRAGAVLIAAAVPVILLLPWSVTLLSPVGRLLHGPGRVAAGLADATVAAWHLPLLAPGGTGLPPVWVTGGLLLAALAGTLRRQRRTAIAGGWCLALYGLAAAVLLARTSAPAGAAGSDMHVWPGAALQLAAAGLLLAAVLAGDGVRGRLATADFGWRQLLAGVVVVLAALLPVLAAGSFVVRGAADPLTRGGVQALPAFVQSELAAEPGVRVLVLDGDGQAAGYALVGSRGARLGDADLTPAAGQQRRLDDIVGDLLSASGSDAAGALGTRAVRYVALPADGSTALAAALDAQPGLARRARRPVLLWQVTAPAARLTVLAPELAQPALRGVRAPDVDQLRGSPPVALVGREPRLPPGAPGRLLVLSEAADPGWTATVDGRVLPRRTAWGWAAAWTVPEGGGALRVTHSRAARRTGLALQAALLLLLLVLAAPGAPRRAGLEHAGRPRHARPGAA